MASKFVLNINKDDWSTLDQYAKKNGFKNFREAIPHLLFATSTIPYLSKVNSCEESRTKNNYDIPKELSQFYVNLACKNNLSISSAISRYVIMPILVSEDLKKGKLMIIS